MKILKIVLFINDSFYKSQELDTEFLESLPEDIRKDHSTKKSKNQMELLKNIAHILFVKT